MDKPLKCLAIGGEPATGKTTLVQFIYESLITSKLTFGMVKGHYDKNKNLALLGIYNNQDTFKGTDKLSMAVNTHFVKYLEKKQRNILFEGDRLFSLNNLLLLDQHYDLRIIVLEQSDKILYQRHEQRNDNQSEKFLKGRKTKIKNIVNHLGNRVEKHQLSTIEESKTLAKDIILWYEK